MMSAQDAIVSYKGSVFFPRVGKNAEDSKFPATPLGHILIFSKDRFILCLSHGDRFSGIGDKGCDAVHVSLAGRGNHATLEVGLLDEFDLFERLETLKIEVIVYNL